MSSFKKIALLVTGSLYALTLGGCASIVNGRFQQVTVRTEPAGAACTLKNNKGQWAVQQTPDTVSVHRSINPIAVKCIKKNYGSGAAEFSSRTKAMLAGNIVFGGVIGAGVDAADGAAFSYPNEMTVFLHKNKWR